MLRAIAVVFVLLPSSARARETDDIRRIPVGLPDSSQLVDAGKEPRRPIPFHFRVGTKRTTRATTHKTVTATVKGETQSAPPEDLSADTTYTVKEVHADGGATIAMTSGTIAGTLDVSPAGKT